jgi:hypothetical protein
VAAPWASSSAAEQGVPLCANDPERRGELIFHRSQQLAHDRVRMFELAGGQELGVAADLGDQDRSSL